MPPYLTRLMALFLSSFLMAACVTNGLTPPRTQESGAPAPRTTEGNPMPARVTMLLPLSGKEAKLGEALQNAATLALADLGYDTFELNFEDTGSGGAAGSASRAVTNKTDLILGPVFADDVRAVRPIANSAQVPVVAFSTDASAGGNGVYLIGILPEDQARQMGAFAGSRNLKNILVVAPRDTYGQLTVRAFANAAQNYGASVVGPFWLDGNDSMLAARLAALIAPNGNGGNIDGIFLPLPPDQAARVLGLITPTLAGFRTRPILMGTGLWDDINIMKYPGLVGGYYAAPARGSRLRFEQIYTRQFGEKPPRLASVAYDAVALALTIGRTTGPDGFSSDGLTRTGGFSGINGVFRFSPDGRSERVLPILQLQPGQAVIAIPAATTFALP